MMDPYTEVSHPFPLSASHCLTAYTAVKWALTHFAKYSPKANTLEESLKKRERDVIVTSKTKHFSLSL